MHMRSVGFLSDFLRNLRCTLGDREYQQRVWVEEKGKSYFDYDEDFMVFMDRCEEVLEHPENYEGMNDFVHQKLKAYYDKLTYFDEVIAYELPQDDDEAIVNSPEWHKVCDLAKDTYDAILQNLKERGYEVE